MDQNQILRMHLQRTLDWEDAHVSFDRAVREFPPDLRGVQPPGLPYSAWQILEHLRICQFDILDFCINSNYRELPFDEYWPKTTAPGSLEEWDQSVDAFQMDREKLRTFALDTTLDLFTEIPHGSGQTYLRELLLVADHNAYHIADLVAIRRLHGAWPLRS